jgi:hypothetical protein
MVQTSFSTSTYPLTSLLAILFVVWFVLAANFSLYGQLHKWLLLVVLAPDYFLLLLDFDGAVDLKLTMLQRGEFISTWVFWSPEISWQ